MNKLTVIILTYNEERHIEECIKSAKLADEILVVDSGSIDKTVFIAKEAGARIVNHPMNEGFAAQRNFALEQSTNTWVMFLDADERITPLLAEEITAALAAPGDIVAFKIPRRNHFMGTEIKHCGWYPDYNFRLMKKGKVRYSGLVHEHVLFDGNTRKLKQPFLHFTYTSVEQYLEKLNKYTSLSALDMRKRGKKARVTDIILRPPITFLKMFTLRKGILDGLEGFTICLLSSFYVFIKYTKLFYLQRSDD